MILLKSATLAFCRRASRSGMGMNTPSSALVRLPSSDSEASYAPATLICSVIDWMRRVSLLM